ncbi:MAG: hypothetical protein RLZZ455_355 [Candidatus Parcubacteria bacterium]|jgi:uncharacterized protein YcnI
MNAWQKGGEIMNKITSIIIGTVLVLFLITPASAHVTVKPNQAGIGAFQTFTIGVPNEKDNPTISLRLVIPEGLEYVTPNVKQGWLIDTKKSAEGEEVRITEISWTGGEIPTGQRDEFLFSAKVPSEKKTLSWKAYQTYQNGDIVSWDQDPETLKNLSDEEKEENERTGKGPYSQTEIVNDLTESITTPTKSAAITDLNERLKIVSALSGGSLFLSVLALFIRMKKK